MFEGFVGCFSYLELFMKADNLRAIHVEAAAVLTLAESCPSAEHGYHIVTNFYFARCAGNISPTFTFLPYTLITFTRALPWAGGFLAFQAVCRIHADNHNSQKQAFCNNVIM